MLPTSSAPGLTDLGHHQAPSEPKATGLRTWPLDTAKGVLSWASLRLPTFQQIKSRPRSPRYFDKSGGAICFLQPREAQRRETGYDRWRNACKRWLVFLTASSPRSCKTLPFHIAFLWAQETDPVPFTTHLQNCHWERDASSKNIMLKLIGPLQIFFKQNILKGRYFSPLQDKKFLPLQFTTPKQWLGKRETFPEVRQFCLEILVKLG